MTDLIDRQAAIAAVHYEWDECLNFDGSGAEIANDTEDALCSVPSVDAVEVVRCEQCEHYNNIEFWCYYHGSMCFKPNDYCPYGKVRNDE